MLEWLVDNAVRSVILGALLTFVGSAVGIILMHDRAITWLKTIAERLDRHVERNDRQHDDLWVQQREQGRDIAAMKVGMKLICDQRDSNGKADE